MSATAFAECKASDKSLTRLDVAGAFGDIGVLFPIVIALVNLNHLNPTAVFLAAGLTYIVAGWWFRIPMAVQPFKAVAAISLALGLPPSAIAGAGILMGILLALIALTNVASYLARLFTIPIVRGIQLGLGLLLVREGGRLIFGKNAGMTFGNALSLSGWTVALCAVLILLLLRGSERYPASLVLLVVGIAVGWLAVGGIRTFVWGPVPIKAIQFNASELWPLLPILVLPQFALTFGNSIVATENTAKLLYGDQARRVTVRGLSFSIAIVNLFAGLLQSAPLCHGSGGVTAHYKFGARKPRSSYVIGSICLFLALIGKAALGVLGLIPVALLGVFLVYVGVQHAAYLGDIIKSAPQASVAVSVGIVALLTTNLLWGFLVGFTLQGAIILAQRIHSNGRHGTEGTLVL